MQPRSQRRVHGAEFKARVLAECQQPDASVAAVALAHGLNVNLLRKWLVGRGIKRTGLTPPRTVTHKMARTDETLAPSLQFNPVQIAPAPVGAPATAAAEPEHAQLRISAIVNACFRLIADGVSAPSWTRGRCAQARGSMYLNRPRSV